MTCELSAIEIHTHLLELQAERASASIEGHRDVARPSLRAASQGPGRVALSRCAARRDGALAARQR
jgi:hypothetical protein